MLALSILAVTTSKRSSALSRPVAEKVSGSSACPISVTLGPRPPPAAIAPGPAGLGAALGAAFAPAFLPPALGAAFAFDGADASSSASRRAFSAFRASSALRLSSLSSLLLLAPFEPSCHFSASLCSWGEILSHGYSAAEGEMATYLVGCCSLLLLRLILCLLCTTRLLLRVSTLWSHDLKFQRTTSYVSRMLKRRERAGRDWYECKDASVQ